MSVKYPLLIFVGIDLVATCFSTYVLLSGLGDGFKEQLVEIHGPDNVKFVHGVLLASVIVSLVCLFIGFLGVLAESFFVVTALGLGELFVFVLRLFANYFGLFHLILSFVIGILAFYFAREIADSETPYVPPVKPEYVITKNERSYLVP